MSVCLSVYLQAWKRSYSARRPQVLNLTISKTQQFCETSSMFELDNVKNEAILRDFFIFQSCQHQNRSNSARLPSKAESCVQHWRPRTIFPIHLSKLLRLPGKSDARSYEVLHLSRKIISANLKILGSKCNPSQEISARTSQQLWWTCLLYCACNGKCIFADPLQMSHACHRFWKCDKTLTFYSLLTRCTVPCTCHAKRHLNVQKWSEPLVF